MRISDWSSDVCSSDLPWQRRATWTGYTTALRVQGAEIDEIDIFGRECAVNLPGRRPMPTHLDDRDALPIWQRQLAQRESRYWRDERAIRSEEHTSELQSLMRISYAVFCLKKKKQAYKLINKYT